MGAGHRYQNKKSAFNPRLNFNRSYATDREPVGCTCNIQPTLQCSFFPSLSLNLMEFVVSLGNFA